MKKEQTYSGALSDLENILHDLEHAELDMDILSEKVKRARELIVFCREKLTKIDEEAKAALDDV